LANNGSSCYIGQHQLVELCVALVTLAAWLLPASLHGWCAQQCS
jgi:hypothetical protein